MTFHTSETLNVELVFWSKMITDAQTELSSLEIIINKERPVMLSSSLCDWSFCVQKLLLSILVSGILHIFDKIY